jgi:hypothetical protein
MPTRHRPLRLRTVTLAVASFLAVGLLVSPAAFAAGGPGNELGQLEFPITGSPACQARFREGMLALHSFEYDRAHRDFAAALAADPGCAMAAWGDAMAHDHPIWGERDLPKARAALARITGEGRLTARERGLIEAARALMAHVDPKAAHQAWLEVTTRLHRDFAGDDEVSLQHALALLSVHGYRPAAQRGQSEAGALAMEVLGRRPRHPGAAHYVIHAFDNREHAILALPAARIYARIAPAAGHALHMPSHIFTHLGMWRDVAPSNQQAFAASQAWSRSVGEPESKWDWHSFSWLVAANLELGQHAAARAKLDEIRALIARHDSPEVRGAYSTLVSNYLSQTGRWSEAETLVAPLLLKASDEGPAGSGAVACAAHAPGGSKPTRYPFVLFARISAHGLRAEAALALGRTREAEARAADLVTVIGQMAPWAKQGRMSDVIASYQAWAAEVRARAQVLRTPTAAARARALAALAEAARLEDKLGSAGPAFFLTARERRTAALMAAGQPREALAEAERVLDQRPNRALSLLAAARAARAAGDRTASQRYYATLDALWSDADPTLPALGEVRAQARSKLASR